MQLRAAGADEYRDVMMLFANDLGSMATQALSLRYEVGTAACMRPWLRLGACMHVLQGPSRLLVPNPTCNSTCYHV